ncbi:MAG TPA: hypothetical protein VMW65_13080 [Chloroflexota bacterium]|nr:hypothetical protein [Chloroflexota bacterium]
MSALVAHFVLDQNFPWYAAAVRWPPSLRISRLAEIEPTLTSDVDDWEVFLGLHKRGDVDGFITNDAKLLMQATEMVALQRTSLALVITDDVGHLPIRATGLVMVHLEEVAKQVDGKSHVFRLRARQLTHELPHQHLERIAGQEKNRLSELIGREVTKMGLSP